MEKKLKKKNNDMFPVKTLQLACTCPDATCTCACVMSEGDATDRYDDSTNNRVVTYYTNGNGGVQAMIELGIM